MKSEFTLAFNEITELRGLPREVVMEALETALISAYRRNEGATSAQRVEAKIDPVTGQAHLLVEKEVVDSVTDDRTEVMLDTARTVYPETQLGDMVMVEADTSARGFGRIAAQTAKQVILQRIREAEREAQYDEFAEREGEIINGTVQSVTPVGVTIGLGRTEALLPRREMVPGEHYRPHDKVRAYVLEVRKTSRGPQIIVSRSHRNMLRRLLEYEVPEIYNGQVEIKNIAREAGHRSKVAVAALQEGVDPVGACVGMRGVRIQSIVRELHDEKIDVIEWNPDQNMFIAKALSPARVSGVYLDDDPDAGRTATVIVPDDQLSLAIGREGQNARLAAKLTGWRIDIKSVTEAAFESQELIQADAPLIAPIVSEHADLVEEINRILTKKESNRPVTPEEYRTLTRFADLVENQKLAMRHTERQKRQKQREAVRATIPAVAYEVALGFLNLDAQSGEVLSEAGFKTVGALMEQVKFDATRLDRIEGLSAEVVAQIKQTVAEVAVAELEAARAEAGVPTVEVAVTEAETPAGEAEPVAAAEVEAVEMGAVAETAPEPEETVMEGAMVARAEAVLDEIAPPAFPDVAAAPEPEPKPVAIKRAPKPEAVTMGDFVYFEDDGELTGKFEEGEEDKRERAQKKKKDKQRRRQLVFDEQTGEVVAKRRRKGSRRADWEIEDWEE